MQGIGQGFQTFLLRKTKPGKSRAGRGNEPLLADAVCTNVVSTVLSDTVCTYVVSTVLSDAVCTYVVGTILSDTVCTYVVSTVLSDAVCTHMVSTIGSDVSGVDMSRAVFCESWESKRSTRQYRESQAKNQFGSFHVSCSEEVI
ncbi:MAG: hypothetical protein JWQ69_1584 [Pseudomonas sp.]|nr:hypothetical protein [Pseudomonas sp.]